MKSNSTGLGAPSERSEDSVWSVTLGTATRSIGVSEDSTDTAWDEFECLKARNLDAFPGLAVAGLNVPKSADDALRALARVGRHCLKPVAWTALYEDLVAKIAVESRPPPPIPDALWGKTSAQVKQMCFEEHVRWADKQGLLPHLWILASKLDDAHWWSMNATTRRAR